MNPDCIPVNAGARHPTEAEQLIEYHYKVIDGIEITEDTVFMYLPQTSLISMAGMCAALNQGALSMSIMERMTFATADVWGIVLPNYSTGPVIARIAITTPATH